MLSDLREGKYGYPYGMTFEEWQTTLGEMVHLFKEANEKTCQCVNPLQDEYKQAQKEFVEKYGIFGEKLRQDGEDDRLFTLFDVPEYEDIVRRHMKEEHKMDEYSNECKNKAFKMFSEHFWNLWD